LRTLSKSLFFESLFLRTSLLHKILSLIYNCVNVVVNSCSCKNHQTQPDILFVFNCDWSIFTIITTYNLRLRNCFMRWSKDRNRERKDTLTNKSVLFPSDEHLQLFLSARSTSFLLYFRVRVSMKEVYSWKIFFLMSTTPRNREGTVEEEETRSGLCRASCDVHEPDDFSKGLTSSFSKQPPICILISLFDTQSPTEES